MRYIIWSDASDDLLWESGSLREVRRAIKAMAAMPADAGDHKYFPILICRENSRSPYFRKLQILERHTLTGSEKYERRFMRENGETPVGTDAPEAPQPAMSEAPAEIRVIEAPQPAMDTRWHCAWSSCSRLFIKADRRYSYCGRPDCPATRQVPEYAQPANEALDALNDAAHARDLAAREQARVAIAAWEDAAYADQRSHGWAGTDDLVDDGDTDAQIDWHARYQRDCVAETRALCTAAAQGMGEHFMSGDDEYIAWPNGEVSRAAEYRQWLAHRAIIAQYGDHG